MTIGERIQMARKNAGMKQSELAEKIGVAVITIGQYERGKRQPRIEQLQRIADALNVELWELVPDNHQVQVTLDDLKRKLDKEQFNSFLPGTSKLDPLTNEETSLKTFLNSLGYDIGKIKGNYYFTIERAIIRITQDEFYELLYCAQSGLKDAAKKMESKLVEILGLDQPLDNPADAPQTPSAPQEGTDTTEAEKPPTDAPAPTDGK